MTHSLLFAALLSPTVMAVRKGDFMSIKEEGMEEWMDHIKIKNIKDGRITISGITLKTEMIFSVPLIDKQGRYMALSNSDIDSALEGTEVLSNWLLDRMEEENPYDRAPLIPTRGPQWPAGKAMIRKCNCDKCETGKHVKDKSFVLDIRGGNIILENPKFNCYDTGFISWLPETATARMEMALQNQENSEGLCAIRVNLEKHHMKATVMKKDGKKKKADDNLTDEDKKNAQKAIDEFWKEHAVDWAENEDYACTKVIQYGRPARHDSGFQEVVYELKTRDGGNFTYTFSGRKYLIETNKNVTAKIIVDKRIKDTLGNVAKRNVIWAEKFKGADIIGLQEFHPVNQKDLLETYLPNYRPYYFKNSHHGMYGVLLVADRFEILDGLEVFPCLKDIKNHKFDEIKEVHKPRKINPCVEKKKDFKRSSSVVLRLRDSVTKIEFIVGNLHFKSGKADADKRLNEADAFVEAINRLKKKSQNENIPVVFLGDVNADGSTWQWNEKYRPSGLLSETNYPAGQEYYEPAKMDEAWTKFEKNGYTGLIQKESTETKCPMPTSWKFRCEGTQPKKRQLEHLILGDDIFVDKNVRVIAFKKPRSIPELLQENATLGNMNFRMIRPSHPSDHADMAALLVIRSKNYGAREQNSLLRRKKKRRKKTYKEYKTNSDLVKLTREQYLEKRKFE